MAPMKLYGELGWGSVIVETQLEWYGFPYELERVGDLLRSESARERLAPANPLAQVPTLILPDGAVMTESAAITLYLAELAESDALVPAAGDPLRPAFLRWLVFLVANVYPTYTYGDVPARFVSGGGEAERSFRDTVLAYARKLYGILDDAAAQPWFLGERFSALDIYVCAMSRWRPGRAWFEANAPKLHAIATATEGVPELEAVWRRNAS